MKPKILLDTGPLVAFLNQTDAYHVWAKTQLSLIAQPMLTCEAVITEACYLLRAQKEGPAAILQCLQRGLITIEFAVTEEAKAVQALMARYANLPMSFADACLVRMAEQIGDSVILTLDSDFQVYRKHSRQVIPLMMP